jgi:ribosomal protein S27AE
MKIDKLTVGIDYKLCNKCEAYHALKAQRMTARWVYHAPSITNIEIREEMQCSACGNSFPRRDGDRWYYCPRCGSKMEG